MALDFECMQYGVRTLYFYLWIMGIILTLAIVARDGSFAGIDGH